MDLELTRAALDPLVPRSVKIREFGGCSCSKRRFVALWRMSRLNKQCKHCAKCSTARAELHRDTACKAVDVVVSLDPECCVFPEFLLKDMAITAPMSRKYSDILFVLSNFRVVAVEVDGKSHKNKNVEAADKAKELVLKRAGAQVFRVDSECSGDTSTDLDFLREGVLDILKL